jgi:signal transduction histidine kinase
MMKTDDRIIQLTVIGDEKPVMADEFLITHVIDNLISNSIKYSRNAPAPEIKILFEETGCIISVKDHGIGIDEEDQQKMFNSFFRSLSVKDIPGTGLGLVIAKKMLDLHNGEISVKSARNEGTEIITKLIYE